MATYVPRVKICGDVETFRKIIGNKPVEIVDGNEEYLIFTDPMELNDYLEKFPLNNQAMSAIAFVKKIHDGFFSVKTFMGFYELLARKNFNRLLDFDSYFIKNNLNTRGELDIAIDCLGENFYPIVENIYDKIYRTFDECRFHIYDAIIFSNERTPDEFIDVLIKTNDTADKVLLFVRKNSPLENWLAVNQNIFAQIESFQTENGAWCLIKKIMPPADVRVYIVTHKDAKLSKLLPCYKIIHAGHARAKNDFGYIGDDTGDNISRLNPFLDEVTALYWIWKNTNHTHTGFVHYRRFLTSNSNQKCYLSGVYYFNIKNLLSESEILKILSEYDIIVHTERITDRTQLELMIYSTKFPELVELSEKVVRKHLTKNQPDYLDAYDSVINDFAFFLFGIHITRRNILDAYCEWLFSFMIDATEELAAKVKIGDTKLIDAPHVFSRMMSFFSERMLTVWLKKNHLRIKTLPIMYRDDV